MTTRYAEVVTKYGARFEAEFGLSTIQACGFWGNFARETGEFVHYQEIGSRANTGGRSWAQWTGARRVQFLAHCKTHGLDPKSDEAGYVFLCFELHGAYKSVVTAVKKCKTIESATTTVERLYEGAGVKAMGQRVALAHKAYQIRTGTSIPPAAKPNIVAKPKAAPKKPVAKKAHPISTHKARTRRRVKA